MSERLEVTVLLPCLNEADTLGDCIDEAWRGLGKLGVHGEVLVADNGSTDGCERIIREHGARMVHVPVAGYGRALIAGISAAQGRYVIIADADGSYDVGNIAPFLLQLRAGHDLVVGNRFRGGIAPGAMPFLNRYLGNPMLSGLGRALFRVRDIGDFHCGMRGMDRGRIDALQLRAPGMEFASEMIIRSVMAGYGITEVPATLRPDGRTRRPHLRPLRDGWRHLVLLFSMAAGIETAVPTGTAARPSIPSPRHPDHAVDTTTVDGSAANHE